MTGTNQPPDDELFSRIRRATEHYTLDRPAPQARQVQRGERAWRFASLVGAAAVGAAATLLVIGIVRAPSNPVPGQGTPTGRPSATPAELTISDADAVRLCVANREATMPSEWIRKGETFESVDAELRTLPLVARQQDPPQAMFAFADDRFFTICQVERTPTEGLLATSISTGVRELHGAVSYLGGASDFGGTDRASADQIPDQVMWGSAAAAIERIDVVLADRSTVQGTLGSGFWFAWWHNRMSSTDVRAYRPDGSVVVLHEGITLKQPGFGSASPEASATP